MQYLMNGAAIDERAAWLAFESAGMMQGHESNELMQIWLARFQAEESRELISELSNYELELIPIWQ